MWGELCGVSCVGELWGGGGVGGSVYWCILGV